MDEDILVRLNQQWLPERLDVEEEVKGVEEQLEELRLLVRIFRWMVLLRVGSKRTGKVSSCFGYAEFQMPEVRVNGDVQQAGVRAALEVWNWKFPVSRERERAKYIYEGWVMSRAMGWPSNYLLKPWGEIKDEEKGPAGHPFVTLLKELRAKETEQEFQEKDNIEMWHWDQRKTS